MVGQILSGSVDAGILDADTANDIAIKLADISVNAVFHNPALTHLTDEVLKQIAAEVGAEVFMEGVGEIAAWLTPVGPVITAGLAARRLIKAKRLFIDKEPILEMREGIKASGSQSLWDAGSTVKQRYEGQLLAWMEQLEAQVKTIQAAAAKREAWALRRL